MKNKHLQRGIWIILFMVIWEGLYYSNIYAKQIFPSLSEIFQSLINGILKGDLLIQVGYSIWVISKGLLVGIVLAVLFSFLSYSFKIFESFLDTLIAILHPLPGIALLPLVILWFGVGEKAILVIIIHSVLWPMTINIKTGFKDVDRVYIEVAQNLGMNILQLFYYVLIPLSLPYIISGLKIGWSRSWRALISSEMVFGAIGSLGGIGWYIFEKRVFMDTAGMYAGLVIIIIIGIIVEDLVFLKAERYIDEMNG